MRRQYVEGYDYQNWDLIELIDELKTRIKEPFRPNDTLHGAMIAGKDYYGTCNEIREFLIKDDLKVNKI
ncbi:Uncharacterised protein [[Clostridium] sordellii]|uniref:hypothetical protein n=1 Tax=Paraclostridium sordellii TaxID=1505 RepID=UPI0005E16572|nr:hypothetical protein [Paeniclostridium sordellii]CEQ01657.1 Uncharacterised protein [[Clostridium] sordellii] [Paeniclostridium sordellii]